MTTHPGTFVTLTVGAIEYVQASIDLAAEYVKLGKTKRAENVYAHVYNTAKNAFIRDETKVLYYLRYAELFGTVGNVLKGLGFRGTFLHFLILISST